MKTFTTALLVACFCGQASLSLANNPPCNHESLDQAKKNVKKQDKHEKHHK